jgi:uncharacterized protein (TIGR00290 family)
VSGARRKTLLSWSSGKDSAWALHALKRGPSVEVVGLLTTINEAFSRVAMHAVREALLERQAEATGLPLWKIPLPWPCPNEAYERIMAGVIERAQGEGIEAVAFGDLFLEDIRAYRERQLAGTGLEPLFPIWGIPTAELSRTMVDAGLRGSFAGRVFDADFLADLPAGVDPCGENGEFHSFATAGPMFAESLDVRSGEVVERDGFVFADLL